MCGFNFKGKTMKFNKTIFEPYKDLFNYYNLIQKINPGYRLYFNKTNKKFTIINIFNNFEICGEFLILSEDIEHVLRFSDIRNYNTILKTIENDNQNLLNKKDQINKTITNIISKEFLSISSRSKTITNNDINKIIGATKC